MRRVEGAHGRGEDERGPADRRAIDRADVHALGDDIRLGDACDVHDRQHRVQLLWTRLGHRVRRHVPPAALAVHAVHVGAVLGLRGDLIEPLVGDLRVDAHLVEREALLARGRLQARGHVAHRVVQARQPERGRHDHRIARPGAELLVTEHEIRKPRRHGLLVVRAGRADLRAHLEPQRWHRVACEVDDHRVHHVGDVERAGEAELKLGEGAVHLDQDGVHLLKLLQAADDVRRHLLDHRAHVEHLERLGQTLLDERERVGRFRLF